MTVDTLSDIRQPAADSHAWKGRFFAIWGGQVCSLLGSHLVQFALVWYLASRTGSATTLATATLAAMLPQVFLSPFIAGGKPAVRKRSDPLRATSARSRS